MKILTQKTNISSISGPKITPMNPKSDSPMKTPKIVHQRMRIGHLLLHDEPHDVVHVRHDQPAVEEQPDGRPPVARQRHVTRKRQPYERRPEDGDDRCETGQHAPEQRLGA